LPGLSAAPPTPRDPAKTRDVAPLMLYPYVMKIQSPSSTRSVSSTGKAGGKGKVRTNDFARALGEEGEDDTATAVTGSSSISQIDALLSVQEMSGDDESSQQAKARAGELLEKLDALRHGLLEGHLSVDQLDGLVALVKTERAHISDPGLSETLDEIELRAKVELAKLGRDA
jgi:hypothetical protein